jgi:hypothetical protein
MKTSHYAIASAVAAALCAITLTQALADCRAQHWLAAAP